MFNRLVQHLRQQAVEGISRFYRDRYLREVILAPSARLGLFAAAVEMFAPGDVVLISPVTCHTVIESLLAANVVPVFVDIELATGNIEIARLSNRLLQSANGIITTNLYGNPDEAGELERISRRHKLFLIEDCAHVLQANVGRRPVGTFGDVSVFSFKKYFDESGGVVTARDPRLGSKIRDRLERETKQPDTAEDYLRLVQYYVSRSAGASFSALLSRAYRAWYGSGTSGQSREAAGETAPWRDRARTLPSTAALLRVYDRLQSYETLVRERIRRARELIEECPLSPRLSRYADEGCHLLVPFFSPQRDRVVARLRQRGIETHFTYAVPMNRLFAKRVPSPPLDEDTLDQWCGHILPVDLRYAREYLDEIREARGSPPPGTNGAALNSIYEDPAVDQQRGLRGRGKHDGDAGPQPFTPGL